MKINTFPFIMFIMIVKFLRSDIPAYAITVMSIWNPPFEKYEIEKSATKIRGFKVSWATCLQKSYNNHRYELNFDSKNVHSLC